MGGHRMASSTPGISNSLAQSNLTPDLKLEHDQQNIQGKDMLPNSQSPGGAESTSTTGVSSTAAPDVDHAGSSNPNPVPGPSNPQDNTLSVPPLTPTDPPPISTSIPAPVGAPLMASTAPTSPTAPTAFSDDMDLLDLPIDLERFRALMGLPTSSGVIQAPAPLNFHPFLPRFIRKRLWPHDPEQATSIYFSLLSQERRGRRHYRMYDVLIYVCLFSQLALSAVLVILAALPASHHITLAILGAINGVIAGILSLVKGQGMPMRLMKYADGLRQVREQIEWYDRELRSGTGVVTLRICKSLREKYENAREDEIKNMPDVWAAGPIGITATGAKTGAASGTAAKSRVPTMMTGLGGTNLKT